jgi:probable phosphoglycerate mutase
MFDSTHRRSRIDSRFSCGFSDRFDRDEKVDRIGAHSYVSPRHRAQRTLELLEIGCKERLPWQERRKPENEEPIRTSAIVTVTDAIREWDYGDYEGLTSKQIKELREKNGQKPWDIWKEGCPGGE